MPTAIARPKSNNVNFGDLTQYSGGFSLPEGDYALEFNIQMFAGDKKDGSSSGPARLGVMLTAHPLDGGEAKNQFYSMGTNADKSYAPDPETGKGIIAIPGGQGSGLNNQTNWFILLKSLHDSGMPPGTLTDDFSVLDGVHVHMQLIPEPEERKGFQAKTGEATAEVRTPRKIAVVSEIKEGGAPWEGGGGIPQADTPVPAAPAKKAVASKPATKMAAKPAPAAAAPAGADESDLETVTINAVASVLEKNPNGVGKLMLRTGTFKAIADAGVAQQALDTYFSSDDNLNSILGLLAYVVKGQQIVPVA